MSNEKVTKSKPTRADVVKKRNKEAAARRKEFARKPVVEIESKTWKQYIYFDLHCPQQFISEPPLDAFNDTVVLIPDGARCLGYGSDQHMKGNQRNAR